MVFFPFNFKFVTFNTVWQVLVHLENVCSNDDFFFSNGFIIFTLNEVSLITRE